MKPCRKASIDMIIHLSRQQMQQKIISAISVHDLKSDKTTRTMQPLWMEMIHSDQTLNTIKSV